MENTFVVNDEPMTIRITIEIIPPKNKNAIKCEESPVCFCAEHDPNSNELEVLTCKKCRVRDTCTTKYDESKVILAPTYTYPKDTIVAPIAAPPKKERKPRAPKVKPVEEKVVETVVDNKSTSTDNKVIARAAQMIRFFCKASGINASDITVALLKEKGAFDIIENLSEAEAEIAIKEAANGK